MANVVSYINNNIPTIRYNNKDVSFDLTKLYQTKGEGSTITTYYVKSTNQFDSVEFALAPIYNSDSSKITSYMVVKTTILSDNVKRIDYLGNNDQIVYSIEVNLIDQTVQLLKAGQATMNCITDFYSNHGWVSVGLWVGTLLDSGIGVTVAAACAVGQSFYSL
ncbi:MAG: hypothetical protein JSS64_09210 [Bacteroidetes bacterium]|nr:hypothetical protein [Bacteroidota bacterium]